MPLVARLPDTREELYDLVWSMPVQRAAKQYAMSDVALAKFCRRRQVPLPPRGYWARKAAGQNPPVSPLPVFVPPPPPPKRISAAEQQELDRRRAAEERRQALATQHANLPLVCFVDDVALMLGIPKRRIEARLRERGFPIPGLPSYGLLTKAKPRLGREPTHEARPCWYKGRILKFLERPEEERADLLELPSEHVAHSCTHCPVHCPEVQKHSYTKHWRNRWRTQS
jgi:hypothetical protein